MKQRRKIGERAAWTLGLLCALGAASASAETSAAPAVPDFSVSSETRATASFTEDQPLFVDQKVEIERRQVSEVPVPGVQRFLMVDPSIAAVSAAQDPNHLVVQGLSYGVSYLHVWTDSGRKTIEVKVVSANQKKPAQLRKELNKYQIAQQLTSNFQSQRDYQSPNDYATRGFGYSLNASGRTPLGFNRTTLNYDSQLYNNRDTRQKISALRSEWTNSLGEIKTGDVNSAGSLLALPSVGYQGLSYSSPKKKAVSVDAMGGYLDRQFWGLDTRYGEQASNKPFAGLKTTVRPSENLEFFAAGSQAFYSAEPRKTMTRGAGGKIKAGDWTLQSETALSQNAKAWYGDLQYQRPHGYAVVSQRSVDADFTAVNGGSWARGELGQTGQVGVRNYGRISQAEVTYNQFRTSYLGSLTQPQALNREWKGLLRINERWGEFVQDYAARDLPGIYGASRSSQYRAKLISKLSEQVQPFVTYRKESGNYYENPSQDYAENALGGGVSFRQKGVSLAFSAESVLARDLGTGQEMTRANFNSGARFTGSWRQLKNTLGVDYRDSTYRFSERTQAVYTSLRTDYAAGKGLNLFVIGQVENRLTAVNPGHTVSVNTGIQWTSDYFFGSRPRKVQGEVFKDLNNDGLRQADEPGIPGVRVVLNDSKVAVSDAEGQFSFRGTRGELRIEIDRKTLPANMRLSSSNPQIFEETEDGQAVKAHFGVAYLGEIRGQVAIDVNDNGQLDPDDKPLVRAVVELENGRQAATEAAGDFLFSGVNPGAHQVRLNVLTLPPSLIMVTDTAQDLRMAEGERHEVVFLVRTVRSLAGTAFWDKNKNGTRDPEEPAVSGVTISAGSLKSRTDEQGEYYFGRLPAGSLQVEVSETELPAGWKLEHPENFPRIYSPTADQPWIQKGQDIPLLKTR